MKRTQIEKTMKTKKNELTIVLIGLLVAVLTLTISCEDYSSDEHMGPSTGGAESIILEYGV